VVLKGTALEFVPGLEDVCAPSQSVACNLHKTP
jgi:hypothetical protein